MSERFTVKPFERNDGLWWYVHDRDGRNGPSKLYRNRGEALSVMYKKNARCL